MKEQQPVCVVRLASVVRDRREKVSGMERKRTTTQDREGKVWVLGMRV